MGKLGFDISALDGSFKAHANRGIGRYVRELKRYLDRNSSHFEIEYFDHRSYLNSNSLNTVASSLPIGGTTFRQHIAMPLSRNARPYDLVHFPAHMDAPAWGFGRYVITVHDLIPLIFENLYSKGPLDIKYRLARFLENQGIRKATAVISVSESTRNDVVRYLAVPEERIHVIHSGVDSNFLNSSRTGNENLIKERLRIFDRQIVLYVGGIDQRKNVDGLLKSFSILKSICRDSSLKPALVMAGSISGDRHFRVLNQGILDFGLIEDVFFLGQVEEKDLPLVYAESDVMFFPSLYEGFGLPPLEAMAVGTPVVSSNTSSMPEVLGSGAALFDPSDTEGFAREIYAILSNPERAGELSAYGKKRASKFNWDETGRKTVEVYESVLRSTQVAGEVQSIGSI